MNPLDSQAERRRAINEILQAERARICKRILELRRDQNEDVTPAPADELDEAQSLAEAETHASLIEAAESRLKAIDEAVEDLPRIRPLIRFAFVEPALSTSGVLGGGQIGES